MRILVTGGTGYLGRAIVRALRRASHDVVLYGRRASALVEAPARPAVQGLALDTSGGDARRGPDTGGAAHARPGTLTAIDGDIRERPRVVDAARDCAVIVHAAALVAVWRRDPSEFDAINVGGLRHILDAARAHHVGRIVYTSSFLALPPAGARRAPAFNDYQRTKALADTVATEAVDAGVPLIRLYPGVVYGPGAMTDGNLVGRQIADHLAGRLPGVVGGDRIWSFAYVDDVAEAHVGAVERGIVGARYELGGVNAAQMRPFEIVRALTGRPLPRRLPAWLAAVAAAGDELLARWPGRPPRLTTGTLEILLRDWPLGSGRAQQDLGYRVTPLDEGVRALVEGLGALPPDVR